MALDVDPIHDYGNFNHAKDDSLMSAQGLFVVVSPGGDVSVNKSAGTDSFGVLRRGVSAGFVPPVRRAGGLAYVRAGDGYSPVIGDNVTNDDKGAAVKSTDGQTVLGVVVDAASGSDNEVRVLLKN